MIQKMIIKKSKTGNIEQQNIFSPVDGKLKQSQRLCCGCHTMMAPATLF
jgi:hypothetical protein